MENLKTKVKAALGVLSCFMMSSSFAPGVDAETEREITGSVIQPISSAAVNPEVASSAGASSSDLQAERRDALENAPALLAEIYATEASAASSSSAPAKPTEIGFQEWLAGAGPNEREISVYKLSGSERKVPLNRRDVRSILLDRLPPCFVSMLSSAYGKLIKETGYNDFVPKTQLNGSLYIFENVSPKVCRGLTFNPYRASCIVKEESRDSVIAHIQTTFETNIDISRDNPPITTNSIMREIFINNIEPIIIRFLVTAYPATSFYQQILFVGKDSTCVIFTCSNEDASRIREEFSRRDRVKLGDALKSIKRHIEKPINTIRMDDLDIRPAGRRTDLPGEPFMLGLVLKTIKIIDPGCTNPNYGVV